jgi:ATP-binding cassette subfamily B protein
MYRPIRQMADNFNVLQMGVVNAERVFKVFDTDEKPLDTGDYEGGIIGDISFKNVWFAYQDENWVLRNINLDIQRGQTVAFVGATGAGKSSLAGLLNRFYDYNSGEISIDGKKLGEYKIDALRSQIGLVLQDVYLFNDSIMNNIRLYQEHITDEEIIEASNFIGTDQFISRLPGGYDFVVGERGAKLSVGQRQLISFVRAYVQKPSILVLDEATSSVDTESEILIQQATSKLTQGRTSIVIAHRLSTIRQADLIVVLEKGEIIEQGTHDELLVLGGAYKRLFELQFQTETFN